MKQDQRREDTRARLLSTACGLFITHGYAATTTQMILNATGLSKGALYHHFKSKADLFEALYEEGSKAAIHAALTSVSDAQSPFERFKTSALAWLQEIKRPELSKLLLELGPEALGWAQAKAIEDAHSLPVMKAGLHAAQNAGEIKVNSIDMTARFISAIIAEAALVYVDKGEAAWSEIESSLQEVFTRLES